MSDVKWCPGHNGDLRSVGTLRGVVLPAAPINRMQRLLPQAGVRRPYLSQAVCGRHAK